MPKTLLKTLILTLTLTLLPYITPTPTPTHINFVWKKTGFFFYDYGTRLLVLRVLHILIQYCKHANNGQIIDPPYMI